MLQKVRPRDIPPRRAQVLVEPVTKLVRTLIERVEQAEGPRAGLEVSVATALVSHILVAMAAQPAASVVVAAQLAHTTGIAGALAPAAAVATLRVASTTVER